MLLTPRLPPRRPQHMQDTGQLHYSTAILPETTFAAPKAHVPGPLR